MWHLLRKYGVLCAQPYVRNLGKDIRVTLVDKSIAACQYHVSTSPDGTVRDFLHPMKAEPCEVTPELKAIARNAVDLLGLDLATIDLVEGQEGLVLIEVNPSTTLWQTIERSQYDLTSHGITYEHADFLYRAALENEIHRHNGGRISDRRGFKNLSK